MTHPESGPTYKRRLAAILAADAAGYSRLMSLDEGATVDALDAARQVFRSHIEINRGRVIDMAGDSVLALFETATGAVAAALAVQRQLAAAVAEVQEELRMRFRIGVHLGDVIEKADGTVYGDGVNIAARLQALAEPGGIIVSESIHQAVRGKVQASFEDQGEQSVKNIAHPVRTYRVRPQAGSPNPVASAAGRATAYSAEIDLSLPDKPSIAVLPFANMSGDPEQEYFCDGISEDIITELSRFHSLFVIARNSSFSYKGKSPDIRQVGRELGVRYVLEGSFRRSGSRIRVTAQLIDALTGNHIWAEKYDRVLEDIFALQEEVAQCIIVAIAPEIETFEKLKARRRPTSLTAYEIAVRAWANASEGHQRIDAGLLDQALIDATRALAIDADSTLALCAVAFANFAHVMYRTARDRQAALQEGLAAARKAVSLDHANGRSHATLGILLTEKGLGVEALASARRAAESNSNDMLVQIGQAYAEMAFGDVAEAVGHMRRALRLSPRDPLRWLMETTVCMAYFLAKDYPASIEHALIASSLVPNRPTAYATQAAAYVGLGEIAKAKAAFELARRLGPAFVQSRLNGDMPFRDPEQRHRYLTFLRIAAGLEAPSAADVMR